MDVRPTPALWLKWLEWLEQWGYLTAGLSFLLLGMLTFAYAWVTFFSTLDAGVLKAALTLTNDLLFVIILLELFRTVVNYLKSHVIALEPFFYVGIIAGIRRILTSGSHLIHFEQVQWDVFKLYLWDAAANLAIVIVLVLGVYLFRCGLSETKAARG